MADPQNRRDGGAEAAPPAKKAAAKKAPAKTAPAKKVPAARTPGKQAPAKKAPGKKAPAKKASPPQPALTAGAAAPALNPAPKQAAPTAGPARSPQDSFGRGHTIPLSMGLAAAGLVALALSRFRRG